MAGNELTSLAPLEPLKVQNTCQTRPTSIPSSDQYGWQNLMSLTVDQNALTSLDELHLESKPHINFFSVQTAATAARLACLGISAPLPGSTATGCCRRV